MLGGCGEEGALPQCWWEWGLCGQYGAQYGDALRSQTQSCHVTPAGLILGTSLKENTT